MPIKLSEIEKRKKEEFERFLPAFVKVLGFLLDHPAEAYTLKELSKATGVDKKLVEKALNVLWVLGNLGSVNVGGKTYYHFKLERDGVDDTWVYFSEQDTLPKLTPELINRRRRLTEKLKNGTITPEEADELISILNEEEKIARELGEYDAVMSIVVIKAFAEVKKNELAKQKIDG